MRYLIPTLISLLAIACSGAEEDSANQGSMEKVDPHGNDSPGSVLLKAPNANGVVPAKYYAHDDVNKKVDVNSLLPNLSVGRHYVTLDADWMHSGKAVDVEAGKTTTLTAALLGVERDGPRTLGLDPDQYRDSFQYNLVGGGGGGTIPFDGIDGARRYPALEGTYDFRWGFFDGVTAKLDVGDNKLVTLKDMANRRVTRVSTTKGEYPMASCNDRNWGFSAELPGGYSGKPVAGWNGEEIDLGISVSAEGASHYVWFGLWRDKVKVPNGERGAGPLSWKIGVLDVDDVLINDAQPRVSGTWSVFNADPKTGERLGGSVLNCLPKTKTSAPLPPGHYRVEVYYDTIEAGKKTDVHIVDI